MTNWPEASSADPTVYLAKTQSTLKGTRAQTRVLLKVLFPRPEDSQRYSGPDQSTLNGTRAQTRFYPKKTYYWPLCFIWVKTSIVQDK